MRIVEGKEPSLVNSCAIKSDDEDEEEEDEDKSQVFTISVMFRNYFNSFLEYNTGIFWETKKQLYCQCGFF